MDIAAWLRELGLERYEQAFRDSEIDADILADLTETDLEELGISLSHRKKLLKAIAALSPQECSGAVEPTASHLEAQQPGVLVKFQAERRQLTVLFCDLVGSTELLAGLDPEDMGGVIHAYRQCCRSVIERWDGHVAKHTGDRVLVYFGWPRAREGDAERAVRAGLELVAAVGRLTAYGAPLAARVGIATGLVMIGDLIGQGAAKEEAVVGETPNLAARAQTVAEPGTVVVTDGTRDLLGGFFEYRDLGMQRLKGFAKPLRCWQVVAESAAEGRFEALHGARLTPLVGREEEINLLLQRWRQARDGAGQVVLLSGDPGIGKSRIALGLREALGGEAHIRLRYQCSPFHSRSALHPVLEQMARAAGIGDTDPVDVKLAKLETVLAMGTEQVEEAVLLLAPLLSIPIGGRGPPPQLSAERRRQRTGEILLEQLEGLAARQPLLMIFEDAQWIDPSTSELLGLAIERIHKLPVLLLVTFRSDFAPPWRGRNVTALSLAGLSRRQILALVDWITDAKSLPTEVLEQIVERTDGVPLFVEELTKTVLESGLLRDAGDHYELAGPLPPVGIPATLRGSLMARLDRWAPVKEVAQIGAAIGREFSHALLAAVADRPEPELQAALDQLVSSELVFRRRTPPEASYSFKHALVQDAAYGTLLKSRRQLLHAKIAQTVEVRYPEIGEFRPEWLAHHYMEAGLGDRAAERWLAAGQRAKQAYANREAAWHLQRCLDAVGTWSARIGNPNLEHLTLQALVMLGDLASLAGDLEEANRRYEQAVALPCALASRTSIENKRHRYRFVLRNGARIAFYEHGSGPRTLLFVAPLGYEPAAFQPIVERLCQEFRIVTIDPRGTGASDALQPPYPLAEHASDVCAVIEALGGAPVIGVGMSRGGNLLLKLAHTKPHLFEKLVTIGSAPGGPRSGHFSDDYVRARKDLLEQGDAAGFLRLHISLVLSEPETRELRELYLRKKLELPRETILGFFAPDPTADVIPLLSDIVVPVLVTHGTADRLIQFAAAELIVSRVPGAQLYAFEGKGHLPLFAATDEFCEVLRSFVRTGTPLAGGREWELVASASEPFACDREHPISGVMQILSE